MSLARSSDTKDAPSPAFLEIARRFYPRHYRRHPGLRSWFEACAWARGLDWRANPYDRFLLRRELIFYIEAATHLSWHYRVFASAKPGEVTALVDHLLDTFPPERERLGVFAYVVGRFPWEYGFRHGWVRYSHLTKALAFVTARQHRKT